MSVTRVGTTKKYADNWENIFGGKRRSSSASRAAKPQAKSAKKGAAKKRPGRRPARQRSRG